MSLLPTCRPGDEIRVIAPASAPDMIKLSRGISKLKKLGYKVTVGKNIKKSTLLNAPDFAIIALLPA